MSVSRRNFLKRAGGVAVAAAVAPAALAATTQPREALAEQRIPEYEPTPIASFTDSPKLPPFPDPSVAGYMVSFGLISRKTALEMMGFDPEGESIVSNYVRDVLLKDFPQ